MERTAYDSLIRGERHGLRAMLGRGLLDLAAAVYGIPIRLRNRAYDGGWATVHRAAVPVVSVGNLTVGGTGKTPAVVSLARWFRRRGVRVATLSRGYGAVGGGRNDEVMVLEHLLPDVPHLQGPDRVGLAGIAVAELEAQVLILDDGFQHRRLARDLDLVLLDALDPFGLGRLLPRGRLREPPGGLRRAGLVMLTHSDLVGPEVRAEIRRRADRWSAGRPWVEAIHRPTGLLAAGAATERLDRVRGARILAFCGIGNPAGFWHTVETLGGTIVDRRPFPDHHPYRREDVEDLRGWAERFAADLVLTTLKDLVKIQLVNLADRPLRAVEIGLEITAGAEALDQALATVLAGTDPGPRFPVPDGASVGLDPNRRSRTTNLREGSHGFRQRPFDRPG